MSKKFFGGHIEPECRHCVHGRISADGGKVFCEKQGVRYPSDSCRRYTYDPLRRVPSVHAALPQCGELSLDLGDLEAPVPERR